MQYKSSMKFFFIDVTTNTTQIPKSPLTKLDLEGLLMAFGLGWPDPLPITQDVNLKEKTRFIWEFVPSFSTHCWLQLAYVPAPTFPYKDSTLQVLNLIVNNVVLSYNHDN